MIFSTVFAGCSWVIGQYVNSQILCFADLLRSVLSKLTAPKISSYCSYVKTNTDNNPQNNIIEFSSSNNASDKSQFTLFSLPGSADFLSNFTQIHQHLEKFVFHNYTKFETFLEVRSTYRWMSRSKAGRHVWVVDQRQRRHCWAYTSNIYNTAGDNWIQTTGCCCCSCDDCMFTRMNFVYRTEKHAHNNQGSWQTQSTKFNHFSRTFKDPNCIFQAPKLSTKSHILDADIQNLDCNVTLKCTVLHSPIP